eukprot:TRINITY_DN2709_c0_g1_i1.p1 TRINITY_DN2709_c0_g1~~TRINITY_DN2709_c0_g1_i1.p1  ORF type:complete len:276 (+),score=65.06 TRINITY_DN2709_c0_g1_i1:17-844(+)
MLSFLSNIICYGLGVVIPAYKTFKAIKSDDIEAQKYLVKQWMIVSLILLCEQYIGFIVSWLPFFYEIKIALFAWLTLSQTKGAGVVFHNYVQPFLEQNETTIDSRVEEYKALAKSRLQCVRSQLFQTVVSSLVTRFPQLQALEKLLSGMTAVQSMQSVPQVPRLVLADNKEAETAPCQDPSAPQQPPTPREQTPVTSPRDTQAPVDTPVEAARPRASSDSSAQPDCAVDVRDTLDERVKARLAKRALGQSYSMEVDSSRVAKRQKLVKSYAKSYK